MRTQDIILKEIFHKCLILNLKIIAIESCTGGLVSAAITNIPGSSEVFEKGLITYSNQSKIELASVSEEAIEIYGAVSKEVISEMAINSLLEAERSKFITIAVSGVAGPQQSEKKPVGLIWLASYRYNKLLVKQISLGNLSRAKIREKTVYEALKLLNDSLDPIK